MACVLRRRRIMPAAGGSARGMRVRATAGREGSREDACPSSVRRNAMLSSLARHVHAAHRGKACHGGVKKCPARACSHFCSESWQFFARKYQLPRLNFCLHFFPQCRDASNGSMRHGQVNKSSYPYLHSRRNRNRSVGPAASKQTVSTTGPRKSADAPSPTRDS